MDVVDEVKSEMQDLRKELAEVRRLLQQLLADPAKELPNRLWRWHLYSRKDCAMVNARLLETFLRKLLQENKMQRD